MNWITVPTVGAACRTLIMDTPSDAEGKFKKVDLTCRRMDANNYDKLFMLRMEMWDYKLLIVWLCIMCFD